MGWRTDDSEICELLHLNFLPVFSEGCGNTIAMDITPGVQDAALYFFDHEGWMDAPDYAVASSLGAFLLLAVAEYEAGDEELPEKWQLEIDPDIEKCSRAPALWNLPGPGPKL